MLSSMRTYPTLQASEWRTISTQTDDGVKRALFAIHTPFGNQRVAELYCPEAQESLAAILYVHWYEPESPQNSNRHQFAAEAQEMAARGAACLLVETFWSDLDFFFKRTQADDGRNSLQAVINLRRALDLLLSQPGIDTERMAYVGHDFGGMYGILAGSVDQRPTHYVIMAATPCFPDWYLYYPPLNDDNREAFIHDMTEIDPITQVANIAPAPILFQFGTDDPHVPQERAERLFESAEEPKAVKWYAAGHALNDAATTDRKAWLVEGLAL